MRVALDARSMLSRACGDQASRRWLKLAATRCASLCDVTASPRNPAEGMGWLWVQKVVHCVPSRLLIPVKVPPPGVRVVPPGTVRRGAYVAPGAIVMPGYVNIGAYVDSGTMVDTWATVGSCAQIGKNVHLSGGVGIGGVLEPLQASPTIIEDNCFIGARSEVVEGVVVGEGSVISMGVFIGQSTKIYDRTSGKLTQGYVPPGSVVVSGSLPAADGSHSLYCAVIVKRVDAQTRAKTSINELLRDD